MRNLSLTSGSPHTVRPSRAGVSALLSHSWAEHRHLLVALVAATPATSSSSLPLTWAGKALLNIFCVFSNEPDALGNQLENVRHVFFLFEVYVPIREHSTAWVHYQTPRASLDVPVFLSQPLVSWSLDFFHFSCSVLNQKVYMAPLPRLSSQGHVCYLLG